MSDKIELNRRRVLGGIATVGAASAALGAGTFAYFSDTESTGDTEITAGEIELVVDGINDIDSEDGTLTDIAPGFSESWNLTISNDGTIEGALFIQFEASHSTDTDGDSTGLEDDLNVTWSVAGGAENSVNLENAPTDWTDTGETLSGDSSIAGTLGLEMPTDVSEEAEGEDVTINVSIQLIQTANGNPTPSA